MTGTYECRDIVFTGQFIFWTRGPRNFVRRHIVSERPITPPSPFDLFIICFIMWRFHGCPCIDTSLSICINLYVFYNAWWQRCINAGKLYFWEYSTTKETGLKFPNYILNDLYRFLLQSCSLNMAYSSQNILFFLRQVQQNAEGSSKWSIFAWSLWFLKKHFLRRKFPTTATSLKGIVCTEKRYTRS